MKLVLTVVLAVVLDLLFGDPPGLMHPVVLMGKCISRMDRSLRTHFPEDPDGEFRAGRLMALAMVLPGFMDLTYHCYRIFDPAIAPITVAAFYSRKVCSKSAMLSMIVGAATAVFCIIARRGKFLGRRRRPALLYGDRGRAACADL